MSRRDPLTWAAAGVLAATGVALLMTGRGDHPLAGPPRPLASATITKGGDVTSPAPNRHRPSSTSGWRMADGRGTRSSTPVAATPSPVASATPPDALAGPATDRQLQELLEQSHPQGLVGCPPAAVATTWQVAAADLTRGGWSDVHLQGVVCESVAASSTDALRVTVMWSADHAVTGPTERRLLFARAAARGQRWTVVLLPAGS